jgi:large subunit ribosomal protein L25
LPSDIPDSISIDVSDLNIGDSVHLKDVSLPSGIKVMDDEDLTIVTILAPAVEKEVAEEEVEEGEEAAAAEEGAEEKKPEGEKKADEGDTGGKDNKE